jgi:two-component system chemotaxis response regulator CheY
MNKPLIQNATKKNPKERLSDVNLLIQDADNEMALVLRNVLSSLGFGAIYHARNGEAGLNILREKNIDIVITDWDMDPMNGIDFINFIRTSPLSPDKTMPIIMLTGKANKDHVELARDTGMTEFVVKPFTVQTLCNRIILVVEHPRNFILSHAYNGPDRRRRSQSTDLSGERRTDLDAKNLIAQNGNTKVHRVKEHDIVLIDANKSLKEKIGKDIAMNEIFNDENVKQAQKVIHEAQDDFLKWVVDDLRNAEEAYSVVAKNAEHKSTDVRMLQGCILSIKSRSGTFGFDLASVVADLMLGILKDQDKLSPSLTRAIRKHIDVLYVIFQRHIDGSGGDMGQDLINSLAELGKKLSA